VGGLRRAAPACALVALALGCASSPDPVVHVMRPGETIYRLSRYYGVSPDDIVRANDIADVSDVPIGARIVIPGTRRTPPEDSIALASVTPPVSSIPPRPTDLDFAWPVQGKLSSRFGWRHGDRHEGIDISSRAGTPVHAAEAGRVIYSGWLGGYGRVVIVKHTGRYSTVYAHNRKNRVSKGEFVERGDVLAEVGSSGNARGTHLHFEIRYDRRPEDPLRYLR
jgi:murein DD-endopeptidase MepM/ murein hydrolase activator NlpD